MLRCGDEYGERSGSSSKIPASSPRPVETTTRSWVRASSSRSSTPALRTTTFPPRRSISSRRAGIFSRRSTECAGWSSGTVKAAREPSSRRTSYSIRRSGGDEGRSSVTPSAVSTSSADSKVTWLDMTGPVRISSALRPDTSVTGRPSWRRPSASMVPAGPAPTIAMAGRVMSSSLSSAATQRLEHDGPRGGGRVHDVEVVGALDDAQVDEGMCGREPSGVGERYDVVGAAVHDDHLAGGRGLKPGERVGLVVPPRLLVRLTAEQGLGRGVAEPLVGGRAQVAHGCQADDPVDAGGLVREPQGEVPSGGVPGDGHPGGGEAQTREQPRDGLHRVLDVSSRRRPAPRPADPP